MNLAYKKNIGFTIIELIIVIAIIALLAVAVFVVVNPAKRIGESRDAQRWLDLRAIASAVEKYTSENASLPTDFSIGTLTTDSKVVLCSSAAELTCDGQTTACAVVDDADFLGKYLPELPVDPGKDDDSDTGYYVSVSSGDILSFGACDSYSTEDAPFVKSTTPGWSCGSDLVDPRDGTTYGSVLAADGNCWMDRNLGATRAAIAYNDSQAYGDLYQWGRYADGHQVTTSNNTATLSASDTPGHGDFITAASSPNDWRSPQNSSLWQGEDGTNNPCPNGWRLPTGGGGGEWAGVISAEGITNSATAYSSSLKFVVSGRRHDNDGGTSLLGSWGYYWSSTASGSNSASVYFSSSAVSSSFNTTRARGHAVRCIRDS